MSKRLAVSLLSMLATVGLVWFAILKAAEAPDSSTAIAAICGSCVSAMIASSWKYIGAETARPSGSKS